MADDSGSIPPDTPLAGSQAASELEQQILLILVGLPGSSKSTFSNALVISSLEPEWSQARPATAESKRSAVRRRWTRVSQDEAPSRRRQECERQVIDALQRGENVVVDRVNFDPSQRAHFIALAESAIPRPRIYALTLNVSLSTLQARLTERLSHPTIPDAETGIRVLNQMTATWDPPRPDRAEGFDRVYILPEICQPAGGVWTDELLGAVLDDIEVKGKEERGPRYVSTSAAGRGRGGYNARGRGYGTVDHRGGGRGGSWGQEPYRPRYDAGPGGGRGGHGYGYHPRPYPPPSRGAYRPQHAYAPNPYRPPAAFGYPPTGYRPAARPPFTNAYGPPPSMHPSTTSWRRQPDSADFP